MSATLQHHRSSFMIVFVIFILIKTTRGIVEQDLVEKGANAFGGALYKDLIVPMFSYFGSMSSDLRLSSSGGFVTLLSGRINIFKSDVDDIGGGVSYRNIKRTSKRKEDTKSMDRINDMINTGLKRNQSTKVAVSWSFVATWNNDATFGGESKRNTFQLILTKYDRESFAIFQYVQLQWTPEGSDDEYIAGFKQYQDQSFPESYNLPGSKGSDALGLTQASNIGVPGRFIFEIGDGKTTLNVGPTDIQETGSTDAIIIVVAVVSALLVSCCLVYAGFVIKRKLDVYRTHTTDQTVPSSATTTTSSSGGSSSGSGKTSSSEGTSSSSGKASGGSSSDSGSSSNEGASSLK